MMIILTNISSIFSHFKCENYLHAHLGCRMKKIKGLQCAKKIYLWLHVIDGDLQGFCQERVLKSLENLGFRLDTRQGMCVCVCERALVQTQSRQLLH